MNGLKERSDARKKRNPHLTSSISYIGPRSALDAMREEAALFDSMCEWARSEVRIWRSRKRYLVVPRSESADPHFPKARELAESFGWSVIVRSTGGTAYPIGPESVQISLVSRITEPKLLRHVCGYGELCDPILGALHAYGMPVHIGSVQYSLCDGTHNLCVDGRKFAGTSQRRREFLDGGHVVLIHASLAVGNLWVEAAELTTEYYRQLNRPIKVEPASHTSLIECFGHVPSQGLDAWCRWTMDLLAEAFSDSGAEVSGDLLNTNTQAGRIKTANRCR